MILSIEDLFTIDNHQLVFPGVEHGSFKGFPTKHRDKELNLIKIRNTSLVGILVC